MRKNLFIKVICTVIAILMVIPVMPGNKVLGITQWSNDYWVLNSSKSLNNGASTRTLNVKTVLDGNEMTNESITLNYKDQNFGNINVESNEYYTLDRMELDSSNYDGKSNIKINKNKTKTLKIFIKTNSTSYEILYYANTVFIGQETKQVTKYATGVAIPVDYKSNVQLNLTSDYKIKGDNNPTISPVSNGSSKIKIFYSNGTLASEGYDDPLFLGTWRRSYEKPSISNDGTGVNKVNDYKSWDWDLAGKMQLGIVNDDTKVWDGVNVDNEKYFPEYSKGVTGFPYATWTRQYSSNTDMRRFQTIITVPDGYDGNDFVRMKSVNQDSYVDINNGNIVPINDNLFVFVYPEGQKDNINNSNYLDYLAFWAGTETKNGTKAEFHGIVGNPSYQNQSIAQLKQTDGWHVYATVDNVGEKLLGAVEGDKYIVDIFAQDYAQGGGMDKFVFEFVKNKAPRAIDDVYIATKDGILNVSNLNDKKGILDNDEIYVPEAGAKAEINVDGTILKQTSAGVYSVYDANKVLGGTLKNFNSNDGTFTFTPSSGYVGVLEFNYSCFQKKTGQDVVDSNLKDVAKVSIYVLPKVTVNHKEATLSNNQITNISSSTLEGDQVIYGWPADRTWNSSWLWPENETGINRPASQKSSYTASSDVFQIYSYIGYRNEDGSNMPDSTNSSKTLNGTFSSSNKTVGFYYEKGKSNLIVESYIEGTTTLLKKEQFIKYKGDSYTVSIPSITGYTYASNIGSLNGYMPNEGGLTIKLYYKINKYNYKVEYYFNDAKEYEVVHFEKPYNTVINSYTDAKDIDAIKGKITVEGYIFDKVENLPLTIGTIENSNVIKVYYVKTASDLLGFYMYPNSGVEKTIQPSSVITIVDKIYNQYNIVRNFKYTFGFKITAGMNKPDIDVILSNLLTGTATNFKLYNKDGNLISDPAVNYNSLQALIASNSLVPKENYTITFSLTYNGASAGNANDLNIGLTGDFTASSIVNKILLKIEGRPGLE